MTLDIEIEQKKYKFLGNITSIMGIIPGMDR